MAYPDCRNEQECVEKFKKLSTFINRVKDGWGGYWFEGNQIIIQYFVVGSASLLGGGLIPLEQRANIESDTTFNVYSLKIFNRDMEVIKICFYALSPIHPNPTQRIGFWKRNGIKRLVHTQII